MSDWKELPRPATPGPWEIWDFWDAFGLGGLAKTKRYIRSKTARYEQYPGTPVSVLVEEVIHDHDKEPYFRSPADWDAIAALPEYVAEVDRLRAWVDEIEKAENRDRAPTFHNFVARIRAGEWPDGRQA